eukprot:TRINITY_DN11784_c0_g1_i1.p1 TRINITY_DN11784_c0_g1~~TRINITY_DN11784_c0_g1_i1.p1  ORF type:complete len:459 (+),score=81.14 TRINITY_DN11784_c0_g1_i1:54-1379(+)
MSQKATISCITLLGIGTIGGCVIQMLPDYLEGVDELIVIDRVDDLESRVKELCETSVFANELQKVKVTTMKIDLNEGNYVSVLGPLFEKSGAVIDLTTVLSTAALATLADQHNCVYLNACVELFTKCSVSIQARHEAMRGLKLKHTCLLEHGMNPGAVSHLTRLGLRDSGLKAEDVDTVHITEFDTHVLFPDRKRDDVFYNTWSPFGLYEEAIESAELAWPVSKPVPCSEATRYEQMLVFENHAGYEVFMNSVTPVITDEGKFEGWKKYQGYVVTHGETETISRLLGNEVVCAFVFRTPPDATESLLKWGREEAPRYEMMEGRNVEKGSDTIGILLRSSTQKKGWWIGSCQTGKLAQEKVSPIQNGATVTVAAACLAGIVWAIRNPTRGVIFPEEVGEDFEEVWKNSERYMGYVESKEVPWELLADLDVNPQIGTPSLFDV